MVEEQQATSSPDRNRRRQQQSILHQEYLRGDRLFEHQLRSIPRLRGMGRWLIRHKLRPRSHTERRHRRPFDGKMLRGQIQRRRWSIARCSSILSGSRQHLFLPSRRASIFTHLNSWPKPHPPKLEPTSHKHHLRTRLLILITTPAPQPRTGQRPTAPSATTARRTRRPNQRPAPATPAPTAPAAATVPTARHPRRLRRRIRIRPHYRRKKKRKSALQLRVRYLIQDVTVLLRVDISSISM